MKEFNFKKIDAFATAKSEGNPAGYFLLNNHSDISEKNASNCKRTKGVGK